MTEAAGSQRTVEIAQDDDVIVVQASGHSWVALQLEGRDLVIERSGSPVASFAVEPGTYTVRSDGSLTEVTVEALDTAGRAGRAQAAPTVLRLTIDASDNHAADGVAELPADGSAFGTVTVEKQDPAGASLTAQGGADEVYLRTTGGILQDAKGSGPVRSVTLRRGRAKFRVVADAPPRFVTVTAFTEGPGPATELPIEFV